MLRKKTTGSKVICTARKLGSRNRYESLSTLRMLMTELFLNMYLYVRDIPIENTSRIDTGDKAW